MGHGITDRDGMFTVRHPAWHGLGTVLEDYPTREEAKAIAHPWEPTTEPLYRIVEEWDPYEDCFKKKAQRVPDFDLVKRSDDDTALLGVKPESRSLVTNEEMYDIAEAIKGEGTEVRYETGGSIKGGRKVWLLLCFDEPMVIEGDPSATINYFGLQNSNDGSGAFRGQGTNVRIVCDNTSQMADLDAKSRGTEFTFRHTAKIAERIEEAKAALEGWKESVRNYRILSEHLMGVKVEREEVKTFVHTFIPMPQETLISDRVRQNVIDTRFKMFDLIDNSETLEGIGHTAYGLLQASIEYSQWYRKAKTSESRFQRAYLDRSRLTADALEIVREVTHA